METMEKSKRGYHYDSYQNNSNLNLKTSPNTKQGSKNKKSCNKCQCLSKIGNNNFVQCVFSNIGICALILGYILLGSFMFQAIEGGRDSYFRSSSTSFIETNNNIHHKRTLNQTGTSAPSSSSLSSPSSSSSLRNILFKSREETVENIWDITVSLNILYRDNWTRLAAAEISRFQDQLVKLVREEMSQHGGYGPIKGQHLMDRRGVNTSEWNFSKSFLYSLTVLTTIGYGSISPSTALGKAMTIGYAVIGIPLMLIYLSSIGTLLSRCARSIFTKALCCCFCYTSGFCCYSEKVMKEKEMQLKKARQQQILQFQEPFFVDSSSSVLTFAASTNNTHNNLSSTLRDGEALKMEPTTPVVRADYSGDDSENENKSNCKAHQHGTNLLALLALCCVVIVCYICIGAAVLTKLESWTFLDGTYFCFMSLSTIGFGDLIPGGSYTNNSSKNINYLHSGRNGTVWFCSFYILTGMALTAMCFNILHDEIIHQLKHQDKQTIKYNKEKMKDGFQNTTLDIHSGIDSHTTSS